MNLFVFNGFVLILTTCEYLLCNIEHFLFTFITVEIACITLLIKIFIHNSNVFLIQKHAFPSSNTEAFTLTVITNHFVLFVTFSVLPGFYECLTVRIRIVKHSARNQHYRGLIVKTTQDLFKFYGFISLLKYCTSFQEIFIISFIQSRFPIVQKINHRYYEFLKHTFHMDRFKKYILVIRLEGVPEGVLTFWLNLKKKIFIFTNILISFH